MIPGRAFRWVAVVLLAGCGTRERLTFPTEDPGDHFGPSTTIDQPGVADTTVTEGDLILVQGRTIDPDGVASVHFELAGLGQSFLPLDGEGADTVNWALQLSTLNHGGATAVLQVYGVDRVGDQGPPANRQIRVQ